ncbi:MAG: CHAT domain-containing protein [Bacteroidia bacterium]|nr:CHAT domain-containing protein [Bacteroidia bacterium]
MEGIPVIFLAFANDQENQARYLRGLAQELRGIRSALQPARQAGAVEVVERTNATLGDILDVFQDPAYSGRIAVFHYGGHADSYQLLLESGGGTTQVAHSAGLSQFLANQAGLQLVFLNGCSTRAMSLEMRSAGIPAVIGTSRAIQDDIAQQFAIRFYKGLAGYASTQKSFGDASAEILTLTGAQHFRSLYAFPDEVPTSTAPWELLPETPPDWRLARQGVPTDPGAAALKIGRFAHVLCNRINQNDEFAGSYVQTAANRPRVYLVHGHREQRHESLVTRFSYAYIGEKNKFVQPEEVRNWPFKGDVQTLLKVRLAETFEGLNRLQKPIEELSGADLLGLTMYAGRQAIVIQHHIPAEYWNETTAPLIKWYAGEFWNVTAPHTEAPRVVIFINILYSEEVKEGNLMSRLFSKGYVKQKIVKELQQVAAAHTQTCTLLTELESIRKPHVDDWLTETNLAEVEECLGLSDNMFLEGSTRLDSLVMSRVETHLKAVIRMLQEKYAVQLV